MILTQILVIENLNNYKYFLLKEGGKENQIPQIPKKKRCIHTFMTSQNV